MCVCAWVRLIHACDLQSVFNKFSDLAVYNLPGERESERLDGTSHQTEKKE